ncbi:MAG: hypothetical protein ACYC55_07395 [Candidatus Geothermincolia bacterium]
MRHRKSCAAAVALLVAALVLMMAGCGDGAKGLSKADYKKEAGDIHQEVGTKISEMESEALGLSFESLDDIGSFKDLIGEAIDVMDSGLADLEDIDAPDEAGSLHEDLLDFYDESLVTLESLERALEYTVDMMPVMLDLADLALASLPDDATLSDLAMAARQDQGMVAAGIADLSALDMPDEFATFNAELIGVLTNLEDILGQIVVAANAGDADTILALSEAPGFAALDVELAELGSDLEHVFDTLAAEVDDMGTRGAELEEEIEDL